eukprot:m.226088 g.226088  ORF g.226088 m.226088 type:complete len:394 (-) comp16875_c0_seq1:77-1258(-)
MATKTEVDYDSMTDTQLAELAGMPVNSGSRKIVIKRLKEGKKAGPEVGSAKSPTNTARASRPQRGQRKQDEAVVEETVREPEPSASEKKRKRGEQREDSPPPTFGALSQQHQQLQQQQQLFVSSQAAPPLASTYAPVPVPVSSLGECLQCGDAAHPHEPCVRRLHQRLGFLEQRVSMCLDRQQQLGSDLQGLQRELGVQIGKNVSSLQTVESRMTQLDAAGSHLTKIHLESSSQLDARVKQLEHSLASTEQALAQLRSLAALAQPSFAPPSSNTAVTYVAAQPGTSSLYPALPQSHAPAPAPYQSPIVPSGAVASSTRVTRLPVTVECFRCHESYLESQNSGSACSFHPSEAVVMGDVRVGTRATDLKLFHPCCNKPNGSAPCAHSAHIAKHS